MTLRATNGRTSLRSVGTKPWSRLASRDGRRWSRPAFLCLVFCGVSPGCDASSDAQSESQSAGVEPSGSVSESDQTNNTAQASTPMTTSAPAESTEVPVATTAPAESTLAPPDTTGAPVVSTGTDEPGSSDSGDSEAEATTSPTTDDVDVPAGGGDCTAGEWPAADPAMPGPFEVITEEDVGPEAGEPEEDGSVPHFTLFRPDNIAESTSCHPVITWGNGTGSTPNLYGGLLRHLASHGFVVVGSNSTNVSRGEPKPMNVGIDWVLQQNEDPASALYHRIDTAHIGATGHSQGAMATSQASSNERIVTSLPIEGAMAQRDLHGPAMFFCGGLDDIVGCDGAARALESVTTLPAMYANFLSVDHGSWLSFRGNDRTEVEIAVTAWMRVHLMADAALRGWFYGEECELCTNSGWEIDRKNMDE